MNWETANLTCFRLLFAALLTLAATAVAAQESPAYVTKLDATVGVGHIQLTWKDADGWAGAKYEIWRSEKELVRDSLPSAKLVGTVDSGVMAFDDTTVTGPSFYLVLLKDTSGTRRSFYIPGRNKTSTALTPIAANPKATAVIRNLAVTLSGKNLLLAFQAIPADRKLNLYRTTTPVKSVADLKGATLLGQTTGTKSPWVDTPAPGLEFYYTVVDALAYTEGAADAFASQNTTDSAYGFALVAGAESAASTAIAADLRPVLDQSLRPLPLPLMSLSLDPVSGEPMARPPATLSSPLLLAPATEKVLSAWARGGKTTTLPLPLPVVLPEEKLKNLTGSPKLLAQVIQSYFLQKDWTSSSEQLALLAKLELSTEVAARVSFYRGQAYAMQKSYRLAFLEFLSAKDALPKETQPWLDSLFTLLPTIPN
ncbi:MAG: hypothetical protein WCG80_12420 [Spirochaetales bacterium]